MTETAVQGECPACNSPESRVLFRATDRLYRTTSKEFSVVECLQCRLMRLHPWPTPDELRGYYPEGYWFSPSRTAAGRQEEAYRRFVLRDPVQFAERALAGCKEDGLVLDVGCGSGLFLRMMAERGARAVGLDVALDAGAIAWRQNHVPVVCATLSQAPFPAECCAVVTMFHVLEHLYDPASYLEAVHRLLRPGGRLIVQVPNAACWQFLLLGDKWSGVDVPRHLFDFRQADLETLLDTCGFEVLRHKHFSLRDNPAGLASSLAPGLDPMARRVRGLNETPRQQLFKDLLYFALLAAGLPFTLLEAACHAGSTVMVEARKKT